MVQCDLVGERMRGIHVLQMSEKGPVKDKVT